MKNIVVINDEAHHCYREQARRTTPRSELKGDEQEGGQGEQRGRAALDLGHRGAEAQASASRAVYDLSATPFFLRGSGYAEGTLFPWVGDRLLR